MLPKTITIISTYNVVTNAVKTIGSMGPHPVYKHLFQNPATVGIKEATNKLATKKQTLFPFLKITATYLRQELENRG